MKRNCYCSLWEKDPKHFEDRGIPRGYCGICQRCGKPGHVQHFPGAVPYTGTWCDRCVRIVPWTNYFTWIQILVVAGTVALFVRMAWRVLHR